MPRKYIRAEGQRPRFNHRNQVEEGETHPFLPIPTFERPQEVFFSLPPPTHPHTQKKQNMYGKWFKRPHRLRTTKIFVIWRCEYVSIVIRKVFMPERALLLSPVRRRRRNIPRPKESAQLRPTKKVTVWGKGDGRIIICMISMEYGGVGG